MHKMAPRVPPPPKDPHLPPMGRLDDVLVPKAPQTVAEAKLEEGTLTDLAVKFAYSINRFTADWMGRRMRLSPALADAVIEQVTMEGLIEESMMSSTKAMYRVTERGRKHAERAMEACAYLWPTPVSLNAYTAML